MKKSFTVFTLFIIFNSICLASQGSILPDIEELGETDISKSTYRKSNDKRDSFSKYDKIENPFNITNNQNTSDTMDEDCTELFDPTKPDIAEPFSLEKHEQQEALEREGIEKFINSQNNPLNGTTVHHFACDLDIEIPEEFMLHSSHQYMPNFVDLTSEKNSGVNFIVGEELKNISPKNANFLNLSFEKKSVNHSIQTLKSENEKLVALQHKKKSKKEIYRAFGRHHSPGFMLKISKGRISKSQRSRRPVLKREPNNLEEQLCSLSLSGKSLSKDEN